MKYEVTTTNSKSEIIPCAKVLFRDGAAMFLDDSGLITRAIALHALHDVKVTK